MSAFAITLTPIPVAGSHIYGADTIEAANQTGDRVAVELFASCPDRLAVLIETDRECSTCAGTGYRPKQRKKLYLDPCKAEGCYRGFVKVSLRTVGRPAASP